MICVFNKISCFFRTASTEIYRHHTFCIRFFAPFHKLISAKIVRLGCTPSQIKSFRSVFNRANTVFPIVTGNKITARIANNRNIKLFYKVYHITAKTIFICCRVVRFINAAIHCTTEMFNKRAINSFINFSDFKFFCKGDFCFHHSFSLLSFLFLYKIFLNFSPLKLTVKIPRQTRMRAKAVIHFCWLSVSLSTIDESRKPNTGVINP